MFLWCGGGCCFVNFIVLKEFSGVRVGSKVGDGLSVRGRGAGRGGRLSGR